MSGARDGGGWVGARSSLHAPLSELVRTSPLTVPLDASVREALERMAAARAGLVVVTDPSGLVPVGVFTLQDQLQRVTLAGGDLAQPVAAVMTSGLITLGPTATAHQAALTLARNGVGHVVVTGADGRLVGVVSQAELFGLERVGVKELSDAIARAGDEAALVEAAAGIRRLAASLLAQGVAAEPLAQAVSTLNDLLTLRVVDLAADDLDPPPVPFCWIALGSEGRLEQTFATDQDNGLVFEGPPADAPALRERFLPFARAVNTRLAACGFALCQGGVMAGNPAWCLSLGEWRDTFSRWIQEPSPEALMHCAIFFDLRPVHGAAALAERLRAGILAESADRPIFLRHLAANACAVRPPLGTLRDFVFDRSRAFPHTLDLKHQGSRLFVDAARVLALANGVAHTSTAARLRAAAEAGRLGEASLAALVQGFDFLHVLRLRNQVRPDVPPGGENRVDPDALTDLDRHVLKEAFRQVKKVQARLALEYQLAV